MNDLKPNTGSVMSEILYLLGSLPYADVPAEVVQKLAQLPRTETLTSLKELTQSAEGNLTDRAMDAILQLDPEFGRSVLLELRILPDWECFFCYAALDYGNDSFIAPLCEILLKAQDPNTRHMAALALEWHGNSTAIQALTLALRDVGEDYEGRKISIRASEALNAIRKRTSGTNPSNS